MDGVSTWLIFLSGVSIGLGSGPGSALAFDCDSGFDEEESGLFGGGILPEMMSRIVLYFLYFLAVMHSLVYHFLKTRSCIPISGLSLISCRLGLLPLWSVCHSVSHCFSSARISLDLLS